MKTVAATLLSLALLTTSASAAVLSSFTSSSSVIDDGDSVTYTLRLELDPTGKYEDADYRRGGRVKIFSGDGDVDTFRIRPGENNVRTFTTTFNYEDAGEYEPSFVARVRYNMSYDRPEGMSLDDWFLLCNPITGLVTDNFREKLRGDLGLTVNGHFPPPPPVSPVPIPPMGTGLAVVLAAGYVALRKRRNKQCAEANAIA